MKIIYALRYTETKWRKVCPLQRRFLEEIHFPGYVLFLMTVAICFEYSVRPAYLKICIRKFIYKTCGIKISEDNSGYEVSSVL